MDYEKLHKDTIAKLQEMVNSGKITVETACGICADFVPKSEDDGVKEAIIKCLKWLQDEARWTDVYGISFDSIFAWFEKQGKKETDEWKEGNVIKYGGILALVIKGRRAMKSNGELFTVQYPNEWVKAAPNEIEHFLNEFEKQGEQNPNTNFSDLRTWKHIVDAVWTEKEGIGQYLDSPFTEEVAKKLQKRFGNIEQILANSAKSCKDEQKSDWTEEDMEMSRIIGNAITTNGASIYFKSKGIQVIDAHVWLNELKERVQPQNRWKPSREQIETLEYYMHTLVCNNYKETLFGLYQDLKKLKGK